MRGGEGVYALFDLVDDPQHEPTARVDRRRPRREPRSTGFADDLLTDFDAVASD